LLIAGSQKYLDNILKQQEDEGNRGRMGYDRANKLSNAHYETTSPKVPSEC